MKNNKNILEMVPIKNENLSWKHKEDIVILTIHRNKTFDRIMHKLFRTPLKTNIELEEFGSFIWQQCDGVRNIYEISKNLEETYGEKVCPVLERLLTYIKTLSDNNFIQLK